MTFFFDNNISPRLVNILKQLSVDAIHLKEIFPADTEDTDWIPRAGAEGWIIVTADRMIRRIPAELLALKQSGTTALFLKETFLKKGIWQQAEWLIKTWQTTEVEARRLAPGMMALVKENGRLEILK